MFEAVGVSSPYAVKYRPDAFLYYQISLWQAKEPIKTWPFTNWPARSYRFYNGDGSLICMREGGLPVATIRLENYRDGLEDFAYARLLEEAVRIREKQANEIDDPIKLWLNEANAALELSDQFVTSTTDYSRDPKALRQWRRNMAELIVRSGMAETLNPWGDRFSLRKEEGK